MQVRGLQHVQHRGGGERGGGPALPRAGRRRLRPRGRAAAAPVPRQGARPDAPAAAAALASLNEWAAAPVLASLAKISEWGAAAERIGG